MLRKLSWIALALSVATHLLLVAYFVWDFDSRFSCHRLAYGQTWLECMHGDSHTYVFVTEGAIFLWLVGGIAALLGRFLSVYISLLLPLFAASGTALWAFDILRDYFDVHGRLYSSDIISFVSTPIILFLFCAGPVASGWLFGVRRRVAYREQIAPAEETRFGVFRM